MTPKKRTSNAPLPAGDSDINAYHQRATFFTPNHDYWYFGGIKFIFKPAAIQLNSEETFYTMRENRGLLLLRGKN